MEQIGIKNDVAKLQQILGSKLYSDKYSFLSETLQNSTDAMRKCGKADESFNVGIYEKDGQYTFFVRDFGCSFDSIEDFKRLMTLLESSKTQQKDSSEVQEIGKFGIGSISVAAYQKEWDYKVYKNGKGFDAKLQEIEGKGLFMTVGDYYETTEPDGVYFEVKVNKVGEFFRNLVEKAKYFQNIKFVFDAKSIDKIYYDSSGISKESIVNINKDFVIYKSEDFQYSSLNSNNKLHICLDQYSYDIRWDVLEIEPIQLPFALRFGLDEFDVNPTREVLSIDEGYKDRVLNKIKKVVDQLFDKYNEQNPIVEAKDFKHYSDLYSKSRRKEIVIGNKTFDIQYICKAFGKKNFNEPTFKNIPKQTIKDFSKFIQRYWESFYNPKYKVYYGKLSRPKYLEFDVDNTYLIDKALKRVEQDYFKRNKIDGKFVEHSGKRFSFLNEAGAVSYQSYVRTEEAEDFIEKEDFYRKQYEHFVFLKESFEESMLLKVSDTVPADYKIPGEVKVRTKKSKLEKSEEEVFLKYPRRPEKYISWNAVWEDKPVKLADLYKLPKLHIYGNDTLRTNLESIYVKLQTNNLQVIMVTERTEKLIKEQDVHNFIHINDLKDKFGALSKYVTMSYINHELKESEELFKFKDIIREYVSTSIAEDIEKLEEYRKNYDVEDIFTTYQEGAKTVISELVGLYKEHPQMYNQEMLLVYERIKPAFEKLSFMQFFGDVRKINSNYHHEKMRAQKALGCIREFCRASNIKMKWQTYNLDKIDEHFKLTTNE